MGVGAQIHLLSIVSLRRCPIDTGHTKALESMEQFS